MISFELGVEVTILPPQVCFIVFSVVGNSSRVRASRSLWIVTRLSSLAASTLPFLLSSFPLITSNLFSNFLACWLELEMVVR